eukprot:TRINITY_DN1152_c0_g1_i1.p1 TRINITY_DN1152_c0_g1~~TRINITY_DN1152_c0_g1_i1.p1  ORF type:complete len:327 (-),score=84.15 TRINITY_DN1152_c0_g1_i1:217-1197(-)
MYPSYQAYYQQYMYPQVSYGYAPRDFGYGFPMKGGYQRGNGAGYPTIRAESGLKANGASIKHEFKTAFLRAKDYSSLENIQNTFPALKDLERPVTDERLDNAIYIILTSNNEQDLHKAIKNGVWTSTPKTNRLLSSEYQEAGRNLQNVFLLFSVKESNKLLGVAQMKSDVDVNESFAYWLEPLKWFSQFKLDWLYVKDIQLLEVRDLISRRNMKDGTRLDPEVGKAIVKRFREKPFDVKESLFNYFEHLDVLEDGIRHDRDTNINFIMQFDDLKKKSSQGTPAPRGEGFVPRDGGFVAYAPRAPIEEFSLVKSQQLRPARAQVVQE